MLTRKIMLLGEIAVGKTSLARRLVFGSFDANYKATLGVEIYTHVLTATPEETAMKLAIWDIDGDLSEGIFSHNYIKGASGALIIGDASRPATLNTMLRLSSAFRESQPGRPFAFVINKCDLPGAVSADSLPEGLHDPEASLHLTSAVTGDNVGDAFADLASSIIAIGA